MQVASCDCCRLFCVCEIGMLNNFRLFRKWVENPFSPTPSECWVKCVLIFQFSSEIASGFARSVVVLELFDSTCSCFLHFLIFKVSKLFSAVKGKRYATVIVIVILRRVLPRESCWVLRSGNCRDEQYILPFFEDSSYRVTTKIDWRMIPQVWVAVTPFRHSPVPTDGKWWDTARREPLNGESMTASVSATL